MNNPDKYEKDLLQSYEDGELVSTKPTRKEKEQFKLAAQATALKDRRVNIRLSSTDLRDIQARAMEEGMPYQTLIASVLHKYVSGRFVEKPSRLTKRSTRTAKKQASG
jgi:predicted DNA binding CopG/RHH family protein